MALTNIEYGSVASSKVLNDNFNYLEDKIEDYSKNIATDKASLISLINSQIETVNAQFTAKLQAIYPIGSIYIGITDNCPVASLFGTWEKVAEGLCLQGTTGSQVPGKTVEAGLPNITAVLCGGNYIWSGGQGAYKDTGSVTWGGAGEGIPINKYGTFDASRCSEVYGKSDTVQPPAYLVNVWRRTA